MYALSHTPFADCINTRPYTSTIDTTYTKQQHETYLRLQLDCGLAESNALAKQPISFDRSRLPCSPSSCRERQAKRASHEQRSSSEAGGTNQRGLLAECRPQQVSFEALPGRYTVGIARALSLCGRGPLQASASPVRIGLRHVAHLQHTKQATR